MLWAGRYPSPISEAKTPRIVWEKHWTAVSATDPLFCHASTWTLQCQKLSKHSEPLRRAQSFLFPVYFCFHRFRKQGDTSFVFGAGGGGQVETVAAQPETAKAPPQHTHSTMKGTED